ncbi:MAG: hypothetical protein JXR41_12055 [Bacteroidales bacterium]|nr:hypothetical protein [Bacteroidales bacterium]MBN2763818.1 hypothetical protein [Bacteroidales bacterium]
MKKSILTIIAATFAFMLSAQPPAHFNYQAVVRDAEGAVVAGQDVTFKIEILAGTVDGTVVYRETHEATTGDQGLVTLPVFGGTPDGAWTEIDWSANDYFIKIYLGNSTGTDFQEMGTSQLLSVPYAMHAKTVETEKQFLSTRGTELSISQGNMINLPEIYQNFVINSTAQIGESGITIGEITELNDSTDAVENSITIELPSGYTDLNTRVLSVEISDVIKSNRYKYGLGYSATNGTVSYYLAHYGLVLPGGIANAIRITYPDELKAQPVRVILLMTATK